MGWNDRPIGWRYKPDWQWRQEADEAAAFDRREEERKARWAALKPASLSYCGVCLREIEVGVGWCDRCLDEEERAG